MFRKLLEKMGPKRRIDPIFGNLLFVATRNPAQSYWEGGGIFPATGDSVEYFVDGSEAGPGQDQYQFFETLTSNWAKIFASVTPVLEKGWRETHRPQIGGGPRFHVSSVAIPLRDSPASEWELGFESPDDKRQQLFTISMQGWKATGDIAIDG